MRLTDLILIPLSTLGNQGTRAVAAIVCIGIVLPGIGAMFRPYLTEAVFLLLTIAFMRFEIRSFITYTRTPRLLLGSILWTSCVIPCLFGFGLTSLKLQISHPDLFPGVMLQAIASPIMASPALAAIMGLDATLVLVSLIGSTALLPLTAPLFAYLFLGTTLVLPPVDLAVRLVILIVSGAFAGLWLRRVLGARLIQERKAEIDGMNIIILLVFMTVLMEGMGQAIFDRPWLMLMLLAIASVLFLMLLIVTLICFLPAGKSNALSIAYMSAQRNMGLMLAVTGSSLPELSWLYFALSQFPIYLSPHLLASLKHRILGRVSEERPKT